MHMTMCKAPSRSLYHRIVDMSIIDRDARLAKCTKTIGDDLRLQ